MRLFADALVLAALAALLGRPEAFGTKGLFLRRSSAGLRTAKQFVGRDLRQAYPPAPAIRKYETFVDLVRPTGYNVEEHDVTTDDGYILKVHRMPGGPKSRITPNKPVILFVHGLLASSDIWVLKGPGQDLSYMAVDAGYDAWFMNMRGNFYSRRHKKLVPKEEKFWRFSWHECGIYDIPSVIDYILSTTGQERLTLIGHSMGTTTAFVLLSARPEYNAKINIIVSFAPIAIFTHLINGPVSTIAIRYGRQLQKTLKTLGVHEIFPRNPGFVNLYETFCQTPHIELLCQKLTLNMAGILKSGQFDAIDINMVPRMLNHYPQGTSVDTLLHYRQNMISGKFRPYDFGPDGNYIRYKNVTPPEYPLERVMVPTILYYGLNDGYTTKEDVLALKARLPNVESKVVPHERFSHLDFIFSNLTGELYRDVLREIDLYLLKDSGSAAAPTLAQAIEYAKLAPTTVTV